MKMPVPYRLALISQLWSYQSKFFPDQKAFFDQPASTTRPPVFLKEKADANVIAHPGASADDQRQVLDLIPPPRRHRAFHSTECTQALTQSLLGNLKFHGCLSLLADLKDDSGELLFGEASLAAKNLTLEHDFKAGPESAPVRLDGFVAGNYRVSIACALSETDMDSAAGHKADSSGEQHRRSQDHLAKLFVGGRSDEGCKPLKATDPLVGQVLAACVRDDGSLVPAGGHAVLLYDNRNPAFQTGGKGFAAFNTVRSSLKRHETLRKCSWQIVLEQLANVHSMRWLTGFLNAKYGLVSPPQH
jgi:hypothetical protein